MAVEINDDNIRQHLAILSMVSSYILYTDRCIGLNDTFGYAHADAEEFTDEDMPTIVRLYEEYGRAGLIYWAAEKRGYDPQIPVYTKIVSAVRESEQWWNNRKNKPSVNSGNQSSEKSVS